MIKKIIEFKNVFATYKNSNDLILRNVNFSINEGEMVAIIGESGAGKSSIFNAILNQLKIKKGDIFYNEKSLEKYSKKEFKKILNKIGFLSQSTNLISIENVYESILRTYTKFKNFFYQFFKILTKIQKEEIYSTLDNLNIFDKAFTRISELSGGQQKRVEIAKLLLQEVNLILADEPTSNLDLKNAQEVIKILKTLNETKNITILVNIHDLTLVKNNFNKFIAIKNGKISTIGNPSNLTKEIIDDLYNHNVE
ncbi:ATP-binding cassette domain-containing protein [Metamycoplasma buccale]|uniref:ATP-binding cassette domain-containing protein n=1 Tax=Metamycoplasma buccale TaxID=55602 RepID=UPI00398E37AA